MLNPDPSQKALRRKFARTAVLIPFGILSSPRESTRTGMPGHEHYMDIVLEHCAQALERGDCPVASIIVRDGRVVGEGQNRAATAGDPTAHAEVEAIRDACRKRGGNDLSGATLYSAMEPCPMCCWAIKEAKIERVVLGARHAGMRRVDYGAYSVEKLLAMTHASLELVTGVRVAECEAMRRRWKRWVEPPR